MANVPSVIPVRVRTRGRWLAVAGAAELIQRRGRQPPRIVNQIPQRLLAAPGRLDVQAAGPVAGFTSHAHFPRHNV